NGPVCPHCGNVDRATIAKVEGKKKSHRDGLYYCNACAGQFTVTVGTVFESSHVPLNKWVLASHLMAASKKGISSHQLSRMLGVSYKTAWFMSHRIREAMAVDPKSRGPMGGEGKTVEMDETYYGPKDDQTPRTTKNKSTAHPKKPGYLKRTVMALVERGGEVRSFHVESANVETVKEVLFRNADRRSTLYTDQAQFYKQPGKDFDAHRSVNHSKDEWVRHEGDKVVHTNTIENVFSVFKRGMTGVYQHCGEAHLHRYLAEFDFRYNRRSKLGVEDTERTVMLLEAIRGKRLTYRRIGEAAH
ncbi:MAG: IS1595 family transposase, partial [Devosia sp.]|nr:IS1595 family transposase [Devosia sp.]